ncbi:hypothetical protein N7495_008144 [Penicillium taxi]|uniref:uncharacterized protein n=1 Tax=Penicillium taxi TaxID=168475 RepID=UPI002545AE5D|nr:uncharacterized protein N7495_008144 [Penicillium taxi]KAJ5888103.1 hypothetical protein N7495_008144 [Penicillium taxi]
MLPYFKVAENKLFGYAVSNPSILQETLWPRLRYHGERKEAYWRFLGLTPRKSPRKHQPVTPKRELSLMSTDIDHDWSTLEASAKLRVEAYNPASRPSEDKLKSSLIALIKWLPQGGRDSLARDILDSKTDEELHAVFFNLLTGLTALRIVRARTRAPTVTSSPIPKRQDNLDAIDGSLENQNRSDTFRDACFLRDGYRCVLSRQMDNDYFNSIKDDPEVDPDTDDAACIGAHVIPFSYAHWKAGVLFRCFPTLRKTCFTSKSINSTYNGLTLTLAMHREFGTFQIAFKPTEDPDVYEIKTYSKCTNSCKKQLPKDRRVTFTLDTNISHREMLKYDLTLPSRDLLECHWRLAEVLNISAMAEVVELYWKEWDKAKVTAPRELDKYGRTNIEDFLQRAFWEHQVSG